MRRIVILGGGTGGTLTANRLRRALPTAEATITVVDQDDRHVYQPGLLFVPFGLVRPDEIVRSRGDQLHDGVSFLQDPIDYVDIETCQVHLTSGRTLDYDVLVIASGAVLAPEETEGLTGTGWNSSAFTFYNPDGAAALAGALEWFNGGRLVVNVVEMPIKCPVAPLEFCFLADWYFRERGVRHQVDLTYVTPLDGAFTTPVAKERLGDMLLEKGIELVTEFNTGEIVYDADTDSNAEAGHADTSGRAGGRLVSYDERKVPFDLAVVIPVHNGAAYVSRSPGLGDALGFVEVDVHTLQSKASPQVFAIGDAAAIPISKAGSVTHFEGEVLVENIVRFLDDQPLDASYDGHANCFIETGFSKAMLIDFNYDVEPLPGRFPGPMGLPLMKQTHMNHLGKLMFEWFYWHSLLPGRDIPGIHSAMPTSGKHIDNPVREEVAS